MDGPQLEISLPQGWGVGELQALLAPVRDVDIRMVDGLARISFRSEDSARAAACLMQLNQGALNHNVQISTPSISTSTAATGSIGTIATMLLVSHRHTWRLVEGIHASLVDMYKNGPVHKADALLQRLQVASLMRQLEEQTSTAERYKQDLDSRSAELSTATTKVAATTDIQEQLNEAAKIIQSTRQQLQQARERVKSSESAKEEAQRKQERASVELENANQAHVMELERVRSQVATQSSALDFGLQNERLQRSELSARSELQSETFTELLEATTEQHHSALQLSLLHYNSLREERESHCHVEGTLEEYKATIDTLTQKHKEEADHTDEQSAISQKIIDDLVSSKETSDNLLAEKDERVRELELTQQSVLQERGQLQESNAALRTELAELQEKLEAAAAADKDYERSIGHLEREVEDYKFQKHALVEETSKYQSQVAHLQGLYETQRSTADSLTVEIEELKRTTKKIPETLDAECNTTEDPASQGELEALKQELNAKAAEAALWKNEATLRSTESTELSKLEQRVKIYMERETQLKNALRKSGLELDRLSEACHTTQAALQAKTQLNDTLEDRVKDLTADVANVQLQNNESSWIKEQHEAANTELQAARNEVAVAKHEAQHYETEAYRFKESSQKLQVQLEEATRIHEIEREKLKSTIQDNKTRIERLSEEASKSRAQMQQAAASLEAAVSVQSAEANRRHETERLYAVEMHKLRETTASKNNTALQAQVELDSVKKELRQERARREDLEQYMLASKESNLIAKNEMEEVMASRKTLQQEVEELKKELSSDALHTSLLQKKLITERDNLSGQVTSLQARFAVVDEKTRKTEEQEAALQSDVMSLHEEVDKARSRYLRAETELEESVTKNIETMRMLGQYKAKSEALQEELNLKVVPVEKDCQQCEVYQAARRLQQEVMSGMQADTVDANAEAEATRLKLEDALATNLRLDMEAASLRAMVAEADAHCKTLEGRPTSHEHAKLLERTTAAENAAAVLENNATAALREARVASQQTQESSEEVLRLQKHIAKLEHQIQETSAVYQSRLENQDMIIKSGQQATFKAEHEEWGSATSLTLNNDGTFVMEEKEGYWALDIEQDGKDDRPQGLELRLRWADRPEEVVVSDNRGELWVGANGFRLEIIGDIPDWFSSKVFRKGVEEAEARATAAEWRATSQSQSPKRYTSASPTYKPTFQPPPPASPNLQAIKESFRASYPTVDATALAGVAANVADGLMGEVQARQMLSEMSEVDAFEDM
eukprot:TRINITY_DN17458_c0_g1_i2.p1 TRINITY_DN17458_c0_g1~~TRINITY_DN17458_c0_g1_i2.p1  ORF type:complete len:1254 (+),score=355.45 TRINITY_DN17458_c0_g1_i2:47-3808(+)